ncbi:UNVERIFIED_CONTAM: hypothetical protein Slati_1529300 [Sesamum latifolium]|uniref:Reverse transcriptase domain-containing protein n=1 Tax=Sesamum latifolium TaxID=2727402 RepID=A0AAW2X934_9LAMI
MRGEWGLEALISGVSQVEGLAKPRQSWFQMETNLERLKRTLVLTEDEEVGMAVKVPEGQGVGEHRGYLVVGCLLTPRAFRYDVLKNTLLSVIRPIRDMDVKLLADHRFLIRFNHMADRDRALRGCPWAFDRNLIISAIVKDEENPLSVQLNWCPFYVHVHGLPLRWMTREIAESIGNRMGRFLEYDSSNSWGQPSEESRSVGIPIPGITRNFIPYSGPWGRSNGRRGASIFDFSQNSTTDRNHETGAPAELEGGAAVRVEQRIRIEKERIRIDSEQGEYSGERRGMWIERGKVNVQGGDVNVGDMNFRIPTATPSPLFDQNEQSWSEQLFGEKGVREGVSSTVSSPVSESAQSTHINDVGLITIPIAFTVGQTGRRGGHGRRGRGRISKTRGSLKRKEGFHDGETTAKKPMLLSGKGELEVSRLRLNEVTEVSTAKGEGYSISRLDASETPQPPPRTMIVLAWNCRGLGTFATVRKLGDTLRQHRPAMMFLSETKCGHRRFELVKQKLGLFGVCVPARGNSGGLALLWQQDVRVQLRSFSCFHIDVEVLSAENIAGWRCTGFYGAAEASQRKVGWDTLTRLSRQSDAPWLCIGDFNEILFQHEKTGAIRPAWQISDFRQALNDSDLSDLGYSGSKFTWCNRRQHPDTVRARLDRAVANPAWLDRFSRYTVTHIAACQSDHKMVILEMVQQGVQTRRRRTAQFRFDARWLESDDCKRVIEEAWGGEADGDAHLVLWKKIQQCRIGLLRWKRLEFDPPQHEVRKLEERASARKRYNTISRLKDSEGRWQDTEEGIQEILLQHYSSVFASVRPSDASIDEVVSAIPRRVTHEMNALLSQPFTAAEKFWNIVGTDVSNSVLRILNQHALLYKMNYTHIVLIPKCETPEVVSQLRPISLCNVVVKIASKCLANRLKGIMNSIISPSQSAFIPDRLITDNVLLAFELNHFLKVSSRSKKGFAALKLDMSKAYDRVEWSFLRRVLLRLGFESEFVELIMLLVTTISYSLTLNGDPFGYFRPERGIQQGDPLSPYLFIFCAEAFSCLIQQAETQGVIQGIRISPKAPSISHLLFADDTLLFCEATDSQMEGIRSILELYAKASGQEVNFSKSSMVISGTIRDEAKRWLANQLGVRLVGAHD